ncbi:MAG: hypothetical protein WCJ95_21105 [Mariniphaga sp.]
MEFKKILSEHNCDCLDKAIEDNTSHFAIKTMKENLRVQDFHSYWEKGKRPDDNRNCEKICSFKGVSISIFNDSTKDEVATIYKELFPLAPKYKPYLNVVKFYDSSGVVKHTPNDGNIHHYDFYKSDTFDFLIVDVIQVNELQ